MGLLGQNMTLDEKIKISIEIVKSEGALALKFFQDLANLNVEKKGHQDFVSRADKDVELFVRTALEQAFPDDGIVGEGTILNQEVLALPGSLIQ
jgi:myo-inositol-1(or 4)-monophosphatase